MVKFAHISDIHIRLLSKHDVYKEQFIKLYKSIKKEKPARAVITGDIIHSKIQNSPEMNSMVGDFLNKIADIVELVIIIPGNHDAIVNSDRLDSLSPIIDLIDRKNIIYYKSSGVYQDPKLKEIVYCVWSCLEDQKTPEIEEWQEQNDPNFEKQYIGLYHGVINGSQNSNGFKFEFNMNDTLFYRTDIAMLGDIHQYQTISYNNFRNNFTEAIYPSSLIQQNFGESPDYHGYVLWSLDNNEWNHEYIEIDNNYGYYTIDIDNETLETIFK